MIPKSSTCETEASNNSWKELPPTPKQLSFIEKLRAQLCIDNDLDPETRGEAAELIEELLAEAEDYIDEFDPDLYREW